MRKTTVYLDTEVALELRRLAVSQGKPQAELIREALERYTRRAKSRLPKGAGQYRSGRSDVGQRAEELLSEAANSRRWR